MWSLERLFLDYVSPHEGNVILRDKGSESGVAHQSQSRKGISSLRVINLRNYLKAVKVELWILCMAEMDQNSVYKAAMWNKET